MALVAELKKDEGLLVTHNGLTYYIKVGQISQSRVKLVLEGPMDFRLERVSVAGIAEAERSFKLSGQVARIYASPRSAPLGADVPPPRHLEGSFGQKSPAKSKSPEDSSADNFDQLSGSGVSQSGRGVGSPFPKSHPEPLRSDGVESILDVK